jgi:threonine/homoserine/homoserine lactone efflux protein
MPVDSVTLGAFALTAAAIVVSPGPDTALILRYAITSGHRVGLATVVGVQLGLLVHTLLAILGISVLIASSPVLFKGVALAGAIYLGWLGIQGLRGGGPLVLDGTAPSVGAAKACRDAVLTNLLNPKVIVLFLALFPNFVDLERGAVAAQLATLAALLIAINVAWQAPLAWAADAVRHWIARPAVAGAVGRGTGAVLLLFAALMLREHFF